MKLENITIELEKFTTKKGTNSVRVRFINQDTGQIEYYYDQDLIKTLKSLMFEI